MQNLVVVLLLVEVGSIDMMTGAVHPTAADDVSMTAIVLGAVVDTIAILTVPVTTVVIVLSGPIVVIGAIVAIVVTTIAPVRSTVTLLPGGMTVTEAVEMIAVEVDTENVTILAVATVAAEAVAMERQLLLEKLVSPTLVAVAIEAMTAEMTDTVVGKLIAERVTG